MSEKSRGFMNARWFRGEKPCFVDANDSLIRARVSRDEARCAKYNSTAGVVEILLSGERRRFMAIPPGFVSDGSSFPPGMVQAFFDVPAFAPAGHPHDWGYSSRAKLAMTALFGADEEKQKAGVDLIFRVLAERNFEPDSIQPAAAWRGVDVLGGFSFRQAGRHEKFRLPVLKDLGLFQAWLSSVKDFDSTITNLGLSPDSPQADWDNFGDWAASRSIKDYSL